MLQGEGGNINSLLAKTASLTSTLADRDAVIGRTIGNLNAVLATVDEHDAALKSLIDQLQRFVSGLAADATIGASLTNINSVTAETADLLKVTRPAIEDDIASLRRLSAGLNKPKNTAAFEKFLSTSPRRSPRSPARRLRLVVQLLPVPLRRHRPAAHRASQAVVCRVRSEVLVSVPFRERNPFRSGRSACSSSP